MKVLTSSLLVILALARYGHARPNSNEFRKIVGTTARQGEIPYILSLQLNGEHHCGASIIVVQNVTLAISAAHCTGWISDPDRYNITVVAGELKHSENSGIEQRYEVTKIITHNFNWGNGQNDISLLFLDRPIEFNENVRPLALPPTGNTATGSVQVSCWGWIDPSEIVNLDDLMTVQVPVVNDAECAKAFAPLPTFDDFLCAGIEGTDSCLILIDSGGPAVQDGELVGIVSWGGDCGLPNYPGLYTEVSYFLDWINENVQNHLIVA